MSLKNLKHQRGPWPRRRWRNDRDNPPSPSKTDASVPCRPICEYFKNDRCRMGLACRFAHTLKEYYHPEIVDERRAKAEAEVALSDAKSADAADADVPSGDGGSESSGLSPKLLSPWQSAQDSTTLPASLKTFVSSPTIGHPEDSQSARSSPSCSRTDLSDTPRSVSSCERPRSWSCVSTSVISPFPICAAPRRNTWWSLYQSSLEGYTLEQLRAAEPAFYED
ncbi:hypothetical protein FOL47_002503 [Perkinsus chesapeaki]|uniref:C3H1-type domain-containing protein n=1 Tax=Perkinsus chesapeaki TaxID=330153 RepID=A0A7J6N0X1_PERCH|nr:hypothetical protein FOL47_002503 [Perkinsus chesapeaki]